MRHIKIHSQAHSKDNSEAIDAINKMAAAFFQERLEYFKQLSAMPVWQNFVSQADRSFTIAGKLIDWDNAYHNNPNTDIDNNVYATASVMSDMISEYLSKLAYVSVLGEKAAASLLIPGTFVYTVAELVDSRYDQLQAILERERGWYESLALPDARQTALQAMQAASLADSYGLTYSLSALLTINHAIVGEVRAVKDWSTDAIAQPLQNWRDNVAQVHCWFTGDAAQVPGGEAIDRSFAIAQVTLDLINEYDLPLEAAQAVVSRQFLENSGLDVTFTPDWLAGFITSPLRVDYPTLAGHVTNAIDSNPFLKNIKQDFDQQVSFDQRLADLKRHHELSQEGYKQSLAFGKTVAQLGELLKMPELVKSAQVFQYGVQILSNIKFFDSLGEKLAHLPLGPISSIASAVIGIFGLFSKNSSDRRILKQLEQIQLGIQQIMQSQKIIYQAIQKSYENLLYAIDSGVNRLLITMQSEFNQVTDEFYVLSNQIDGLVKDILDEMHRMELSIDQQRLLPLKSALNSAMALSERFPSAYNPLYEVEVRNLLSVLEFWTGELLCDPTFTGDTETAYELDALNSQTLLRHLGDGTIDIKNLLSQLGFLYQIVLAITADQPAFSTCNMQFWSQAILAYHELQTKHLQFAYDMGGVLTQKVQKPAGDLDGLTRYFQQSLATLIVLTRTRLTQAVEQLNQITKHELESIRAGVLSRYTEILRQERDLFISYKDNLPGFNRAIHNPELSGIQEGVIKGYLDALMPAIEQRLGSPYADVTTPLPLLADGASLVISRVHDGNPNKVSHRIQGPAALLIPPTLLGQAGIPDAFMKAQLLGIGNMTATFHFDQTEWQQDILTAQACLEFRLADTTVMPVATVKWTGTLREKPSNLIKDLVGAVMNTVPMFPWNPDCSTVMVYSTTMRSGVHHIIHKNPVCIQWTPTLTYLVGSEDLNLHALKQRNQQALQWRLHQLNLSREMLANGRLAAPFQSIKATWQLFKAFCVVSGVNATLVAEMNQVNLKQVALDALDVIRDMDLNTAQLTPDFKDQVLNRLLPYFDQALQQAVPYQEGNGAAIAPEFRLTSPLVVFANRLANQTQINWELTQIRRTLKAVHIPADRPEVPTTTKLQGMEKSHVMPAVSGSVQGSMAGASWPSVVALSGLFWVPMAWVAQRLVVRVGLAVQRQRRLHQNNLFGFTLLAAPSTASASTTHSDQFQRSLPRGDSQALQRWQSRANQSVAHEHLSLGKAFGHGAQIGLAHGAANQVEGRLNQTGMAPELAKLGSLLVYTGMLILLDTLRAVTEAVQHDQSLDLSDVVHNATIQALQSVLLLQLLSYCRTMLTMAGDSLQEVGAPRTGAVVRRLGGLAQCMLYADCLGEQGVATAATQVVGGILGQQVGDRIARAVLPR